MTSRLETVLVRDRGPDQEPQPPPQPPDPILHVEWSPLPSDENFDMSFLDFFSLQYGQTVSDSFVMMDCIRTKSLPQALHIYS